MKGTIGLIVRGVTQISGRVIESGSDLRVIGRTGVGYDNVNIKAATARGIPVVFTPGAGARAVAEGAMAMILSLVKKLPELDRKTRAGDWQCRDKTVIGDLQGATLGIVGLGRIGRDVARLARAFDMRVLSYDPEIPKQLAAEAGVEPVDLNTLLQESDVITLHALLNQQTKGLLNRERIGLMKRGAILVNLARGGLIESLDVIHDALNSGQLAAAGLDVYPAEPPDVSHPIFRHPNVLCSPHAMGLSAKAAHSIFDMMSRGMAEVLEGRSPANVVNPEVFSASKVPGEPRG
jgi:phosphoglycerate dehydrogenase-like enzyme